MKLFYTISLAKFHFHRDFRMRHGKGLSFLGEVEHIQDHGDTATVLAVMDGAYQLCDVRKFLFNGCFLRQSHHKECSQVQPQDYQAY